MYMLQWYVYATISAPEMASSTKLWAGSQLLTVSSWDLEWLTSTRRVAAKDQLSKETYDTSETVLLSTQGNWEAGTGEVIKMHGPPGAVCLPSTWLPELLRPGKGTKCMPNWPRLSQNCVWVPPGEVRSAVACHRGSECSRPGHGISPLEGGHH